MKFSYEITGFRNPVIVLKYGNQSIRLQTIGDPHLGKSFKSGVPRNRLGDREKLVLKSFEELLNKPSEYTIILGDLFDKVQINNETLNNTARVLADSALKNPTKKYIILSGNHDLSKDVHRISSFRLLETYFTNSNLYPNVRFISQYTEPFIIPEVQTLIYFSHYNPFKSLDEEVQTLNLRNMYKSVNFKVAFGHWDTIDYDSNKFIDRKIPNVILNEFDLVVTGHEHKPCIKEINNTYVIISGSMQPYAFNEEVSEDGLLYVNTSAENLLKVLESNPDQYVNSNVRIHCIPGKELIPPFNCLSSSYKLIDVENTSADIEFNPESLSLGFKDMILEFIETISDENNTDYVDTIKKAISSGDYSESN